MFAAALDHSQGVATGTVGKAGYFVHQGSHQINAAAADANLARIEMGNRHHIKGLAFVDHMYFEAFFEGVTLNLQGSVLLAAIGVANHVVDRLVRCQNHRVGGLAVQAGMLTEGLNKMASQADKAQVTGNGKAPG